MWSFYWKMVKTNIRSQLQYKGNFIMTACANASLSVLDFLLLGAVLARFDHVKGWSLYEIGVLYGIISCAMSLYRTMSAEIHEFEKYIIQGEFDQLLVRPMPPLFLLLTKRVDLGKVGGLLQGIVVLVVSLAGLSRQGAAIGLLIAYVPVAILLGFVMMFSISLITATTAFWTSQVKDLQAFTLYAPSNAANYPISLYPNWLKLVFLGLLPVGFINYIPALYLLDKGGSWYHLLLSPIVVIGYLLVALWFWRFGIKHYHSTGS
ncbi:ABC transporter permease [Brevibacillus fluminis]|uniref:ABC transporter permease n=1 Tax=Brevibacillus fluminis TaxID=511487 RepID=UPI003F8C1BF9